jgi:hypothetical protein
MYERFTDRSRKVMKLANEEAMRFNHEYLGTEHILLGLVKEGSGVAANVLNNLNMDLRRIRLEVENLVKSGDMIMMGLPLMTPAVKRVIKYAIEESATLKHDYVGTEHILLGLLREVSGVAAQILMTCGIRLEELRTEVENVLSQRVDWGRGLPAALPEACPKCGQPIVRVIWGFTHLGENDLADFGNLEDVQAGRAILAPEVELGGPSWVCLKCGPKWSEIHNLAMQDYGLQVEKAKAIVANDSEKEERCRDVQEGLWLQLGILFDELARNE